jgi:Fe-S oxidoreductase
MIIHEYFHGFQYKHKPYMDYYENEIVQIQPDSLTTFYKKLPWFKQSIDAENQLLLDAIAEKDSIQTKKLIQAFWNKRKQRRGQFQQKHKFSLDKFEKCYETMEGTARYVEFSLYKDFATRKPDESLLKSDSSFKSFAKFKNYNLQKDKWLYLTDKTTYFYATGFNMARLLDKLGIEYKSRLFKDGKISLEDILREPR